MTTIDLLQFSILSLPSTPAQPMNHSTFPLALSSLPASVSPPYVPLGHPFYTSRLLRPLSCVSQNTLLQPLLYGSVWRLVSRISFVLHLCC